MAGKGKGHSGIDAVEDLTESITREQLLVNRRDPRESEGVVALDEGTNEAMRVTAATPSSTVGKRTKPIGEITLGIHVGIVEHVFPDIIPGGTANRLLEESNT